jgi:hypothetical protein
MPITISGSTGIAGVDGSASTPALQGTDTNTGVYFGADTISFSEGGTLVGQFDSSANFRFNSGYGSVATAYGCRAWVNFNGTGAVAIRASGNVTSITDFATGDYQVNITNAMPDANYAFQVVAQRNSAGLNFAVPAGQASSLYQTASTFRVLTYNSAFSNEDAQAVLCAVFR